MGEQTPSIPPLFRKGGFTAFVVTKKILSVKMKPARRKEGSPSQVYLLDLLIIVLQLT
jgi:hypothetical protein